MASPVVNSKIFNPFMPTLFHIALVKVALPLYNEFDSEILGSIMTSISHENSTASHSDIQENPEESYYKAREKLLFIPAHLRKKVMATVYGIEYAVEDWRIDHFYFMGITRNNISLFKFIFYWRSDGTIDTVKTARDLVLNENFDITDRFELACVYCFANDVQTLWAEMEASGIAESIFFRDPSIEKFWIKWIRDGARVHWTDALLLEEGLLDFRLSSTFKLLHPEMRQKFICHLRACHYFSILIKDDLRHCLYAMTKEEEEQVMRMYAEGILLMFLKWPLNTVFLEITGKMFSYISYRYGLIIPLTIYKQRFREESDYRKLLEGFWSITPDDYKDIWRESSYFSKKIEKFFMEKRLAQELVKMSRM